MRRHILMAALVLIVLALPPDRAAACSCGEADQLDHLNESHVVFIGRVARTVWYPPRAGDQSHIERGAVFEASQYWRGRHERYRVVESTGGGGGCGVTFEENTLYFVVAKEGKTPVGEYILSTGRCEGTRYIGSEEDLRPIISKIGAPSWVKPEPRR